MFFSAQFVVMSYPCPFPLQLQLPQLLPAPMKSRGGRGTIPRRDPPGKFFPRGKILSFIACRDANVSRRTKLYYTRRRFRSRENRNFQCSKTWSTNNNNYELNESFKYIYIYVSHLLESVGTIGEKLYP